MQRLPVNSLEAEALLIPLASAAPSIVYNQKIFIVLKYKPVCNKQGRDSYLFIFVDSLKFGLLFSIQTFCE